MRRTDWGAIFLALLAGCLVRTTTAEAKIIFVFGAGADSPSCGTITPFAPCRTLQKGIDRAAAGDWIYLDTLGDFGPAVINKSVNVLVFTLGGGTLGPGAKPCLTVNAGANSVVTLSQYTCDQAGASQHGINVLSVGTLRLDNVTIRNGKGAACGVLFQPSQNAKLDIQKTTISGFGTSGAGGGICVQPRSGADVHGWLDHVTLNANRNGLSASATSPSLVQLGLENASVTGSSASGLLSSGAASTIVVKNSLVRANAVGLNHVSSGKLISLGGNVVSDNAKKGSFTSKLSQQ